MQGNFRYSRAFRTQTGRLEVDRHQRIDQELQELDEIVFHDHAPERQRETEEQMRIYWQQRDDAELNAIARGAR